MSLLLANLLSTLMALGSLGALIIVGRKANETIKLGKLLTLRVAAASNGLERVAKSLQNQRADLSDETLKLEARLAETSRVRREMDEAIEELTDYVKHSRAICVRLVTSRKLQHVSMRRCFRPQANPHQKKKTPCRSSCAVQSRRQPLKLRGRHEHREQGRKHAA